MSGFDFGREERREALTVCDLLGDGRIGEIRLLECLIGSHQRWQLRHRFAWCELQPVNQLSADSRGALSRHDIRTAAPSLFCAHCYSREHAMASNKTALRRLMTEVHASSLHSRLHTTTPAAHSLTVQASRHVQYKQLSESENEDSMFTAGACSPPASRSRSTLRSDPRHVVLRRSRHRGRLLHLVMLDLRTR